MRRYLIIAILAVACMSVAVENVKALGFVVQPSRLEFRESAGDTMSETLTITNGSKEAAHFEIYADDFESDFMITPARFDLKAEGAQIATVRLRTMSSATLATNISVLAKSITSGTVSFQTGIKIPVGVVPRASSNLRASIGDFGSIITDHWLISLMILACLALVLGMVQKKSSQREQ